MESCSRCHGTGLMDVECCNGSSGCSCGGDPVMLSCTYCGGRGEVENQEEAIRKGHGKFMMMYGGRAYLGSGPTR